MDEQLIRRLALKQQNLEIEVERIGQQASVISKDLGSIRTFNIKLENSWNLHLAKAVRQSKLSPVAQQQSTLQYSLLQLKKIRQDLQLKKLLEQQQKDKLQKIISKATLAKQHLQICKNKQKAIVLKHADLKAEAESDCLVNLRYVENAALQRPKLGEDVSKLETRFEDKTIREIQDLKLDPVIQESNYSAELSTRQSMQTVPLTRSENVVKDPVSQKSDLWKQAEKDRQNSDTANQTFKMEYLETENGTCLSVDYLLKPGHLFGLHAFQAGSHNIANIQINASNNLDRNILLEHLEVLEQQTRAKIKIV